MRYDEFRDRWQAALRAVHAMSYADRPDEIIDVRSMSRTWRVHLVPREVEPFHTGASISFRWDPFEAARSYTCEEDLLRELFGREVRLLTGPRLVRLDIMFRAALPYGATAPVPAPDVWRPWAASAVEKIDGALATKRRRTREVLSWRGDLEVVGHTSSDGAFALHGMSLPAFEMAAVRRIWDDPKRQEKEPPADAEIDALARRFGAAVAGWTASVGELARWIRLDPGSRHSASRRSRSGFNLYDDDTGPVTIN